MALVQWARSIIKDQSNWDEEKHMILFKKFMSFQFFKKC